MTDLHQVQTAQGLITEHGDPVDAWHDHTRDAKPMAAHAEIGNPRLVMAVGIGLFLLILVAVVAVDRFYRGYAGFRLAQAEITQDPTSPALVHRIDKTQMMAEQQGSVPTWVVLPPIDEKTPPKAIIQIPIASATQKVLADYAARMGGTPGTGK